MGYILSIYMIGLLLVFFTGTILAIKNNQELDEVFDLTKVVLLVSVFWPIIVVYVVSLWILLLIAYCSFWPEEEEN